MCARRFCAASIWGRPGRSAAAFFDGGADVCDLQPAARGGQELIVLVTCQDPEQLSTSPSATLPPSAAIRVQEVTLPHRQGLAALPPRPPAAAPKRRRSRRASGACNRRRCGSGRRSCGRYSRRRAAARWRRFSPRTRWSSTPLITARLASGLQVDARLWPPATADGTALLIKIRSRLRRFCGTRWRRLVSGSARWR